MTEQLDIEECIQCPKSLLCLSNLSIMTFICRSCFRIVSMHIGNEIVYPSSPALDAVIKMRDCVAQRGHPRNNELLSRVGCLSGSITPLGGTHTYNNARLGLDFCRECITANSA